MGLTRQNRSLRQQYCKPAPRGEGLVYRNRPPEVHGQNWSNLQRVPREVSNFAQIPLQLIQKTNVSDSHEAILRLPVREGRFLDGSELLQQMVRHAQQQSGGHFGISQQQDAGNH